MQTNNDYLSYLNSMKNYKPSQGRSEYQAPYVESFEKLFENIKDDVELKNAKQILSTLSQSELKSIQNYHGLADSIDVDSLSDEGAYNLLMHDNQKYDFDGDGFTQTGLALGTSALQNMPKDVRVAYVNTLNQLSDEDRLSAQIPLLTFNIKIDETQYEKPTLDFSYLKERFENIINPTPPAYSSPELKESTKRVLDTFEKNYQQINPTYSDKTDFDVETFLKNLQEKGAQNFLAEFNQEKIEQLIEEKVLKFRQNLITNGENSQDMQKLIDEYKKNLIQDLENSLDNSDDKGSQIALIKFLAGFKSSNEAFLSRLLQRDDD